MSENIFAALAALHVCYFIFITDEDMLRYRPRGSQSAIILASKLHKEEEHVTCIAEYPFWLFYYSVIKLTQPVIYITKH